MAKIIGSVKKLDDFQAESTIPAFFVCSCGGHHDNFVRKQNVTVMFRHYLKIAFRNIRKYALQNTVSIIGLAAGFIALGLSSMWVNYENSYDTFHKDYDRIWSFYSEYQVDSGSVFNWIVSKPDISLKGRIIGSVYARYMEHPEDWPEIEDISIYSYNRAMDGKPGELHADENFFNIFSLDVLAGETKATQVLQLRDMRYQSEGKTWSYPGVLSMHALRDNLVKDGAPSEKFTVILRFRRDGTLPDANKGEWLLQWGYGNKGGFLFGFEGNECNDKGEDVGKYLRCYCWQPGSDGKAAQSQIKFYNDAQLYLPTNVWTDLGISVDGDRLQVVMARAKCIRPSSVATWQPYPVIGFGSVSGCMKTTAFFTGRVCMRGFPALRHLILRKRL